MHRMDTTIYKYPVPSSAGVERKIVKQNIKWEAYI